MKMILSPSVLSADFGRLADEVKTVDNAGCDYIHLDVMDGSFVPNISFGAPVIKSIRSATDKVFDVHLMIDEPIRYLEDYKLAGADIVTVHAEACKHLERTISMIHELGMKASVALNPTTSLSAIDYIAEELDMVVLMSVNPGFGGQRFLPATIRKVKELRKLLAARDLVTDIEVDGGITHANAASVIEAGANVLVAGSAVFKGNRTDNVKQFQEILKKYEGEKNRSGDYGRNSFA